MGTQVVAISVEPWCKFSGAGVARNFVQDAKEKVRSYRRNSISQKLPLPDDPPPPYTPSVEHLNDLSANTTHNGTNSYNSSLTEPSAPRVSSSTVNIPENSHNNESQHRHSASHHVPSSTVLPHSPPSSIYPNLPSEPPVYTDPGVTPRTHPFHIPNSPSLPEDSHPPSSPTSPHSNSAPNLVEDSHIDQGLRYPPFNVHDNSSFNDSSFHPDTSSSSPNLASTRKPSTSTPDSSPPFNPYYDWLPARGNDIRDNNSPEYQSHPTSEISKENADEPCVQAGDPSVRPRVNRNPFLDNYTDEDLCEESLSGALRKSSIR